MGINWAKAIEDNNGRKLAQAAKTNANKSAGGINWSRALSDFGVEVQKPTQTRESVAAYQAAAVDPYKHAQANTGNREQNQSALAAYIQAAQESTAQRQAQRRAQEAARQQYLALYNERKGNADSPEERIVEALAGTAVSTGSALKEYQRAAAELNATRQQARDTENKLYTTGQPMGSYGGAGRGGSPRSEEERSAIWEGTYKEWEDTRTAARREKDEEKKAALEAQEAALRRELSTGATGQHASQQQKDQMSRELKAEWTFAKNQTYKDALKTTLGGVGEAVTSMLPDNIYGAAKRKQEENKSAWETSSERYRELQEQVRTLGGKASSGYETARDVAQNAIAQVAAAQAGLIRMADNVLGIDAANNKYAYIGKFANSVIQEKEQAQQRMAETMTGMSGAERKAMELGVGVLAAVPNAVMAMMTGGASATTAGLEATAAAEQLSGLPGIMNAVSATMKSMATNPMYWSSFVQATGDGYLDATERGADTYTAINYSVLNGIMNAAIEIGGGIETLPGKVEQQPLKEVLLEWVQSSGEEGLEEVGQGIVERFMQNAVLHAGNKTASLTDTEAVLSLYGALDEFMGGFVVGAVLGGVESLGQITSDVEARRRAAELNEARMELPESYRPEAIDVKSATPESVTEYLARLVEAEAAAYNAGVLAQTAQTENDTRTVVAKLQESIDSLSAMEPVAAVRGDEFRTGEGTITSRMIDFINRIGGKVNRPGLGDVLFSKSKVRSSVVGHGVYDAKIAAFAAVPQVIQQGQQIDFQKNWKGRGYDTYIFAAPVTIDGKPSTVGVVVAADPQSNRYYLHEVVDGEGNTLFNAEIPSEGLERGAAETGAYHTFSPQTGSSEASASNANVAQGGSSVKSETQTAAELRQEYARRTAAWQEATAKNDPDFDYPGELQKINALEREIARAENTGFPSTATDTRTMAQLQEAERERARAQRTGERDTERWGAAMEEAQESTAGAGPRAYRFEAPNGNTFALYMTNYESGKTAVSVIKNDFSGGSIMTGTYDSREAALNAAFSAAWKADTATQDTRQGPDTTPVNEALPRPTESQAQATERAVRAGYPQIKDAEGNTHQAVPGYTWVKAHDRNNYGRVVGRNGKFLQVEFVNKEQGTSRTLTFSPEKVTWVQGQYSTQENIPAHGDTPEITAGEIAAQRDAEMEQARREDKQAKRQKIKDELYTRAVVSKLRDATVQLSDMAPVAEIRGDEFRTGEGTITSRMIDFINQIGGKVNRPGLGDVLFSKSKVRSSVVGHGAYDAKIAAFAAVPQVIQQGQQIDFQENWKGRGYDSYIFAAPITLDGLKSYVGVVVDSDPNSNRYYVHEVVDGEGNSLFNAEIPSEGLERGAAESGAHHTLIPPNGISTDNVAQGLPSVKSESESGQPKGLPSTRSTEAPQGLPSTRTETQEALRSLPKTREEIGMPLKREATPRNEIADRSGELILEQERKKASKASDSALQEKIRKAERELDTLRRLERSTGLTEQQQDYRDAMEETLGVYREEQAARKGGQRTQETAKGLPSAKADTSVQVGRATTIQHPYQGEAPTQSYQQSSPVAISEEAYQTAQQNITTARSGEARGEAPARTLLSRLYAKFQGPKGVAVNGMVMDGEQYRVDVPNGLPGKLAAQSVEAEGLSILNQLPEIISNGEYVGSGEALTKAGLPKSRITRYDYFETEATINGQEYIVKWDVEVVPGNNRYKTHRVIEEMSLQPAGTVLAQAGQPAAPTGELISKANIAQGLSSVKSKPTIAQRRARDEILRQFSIQAANRSEARAAIDKVLESITERGKVTNSDCESLFHTLSELGIVKKTADESYRNVKYDMEGRKIYVPEDVRHNLGDDWEVLRKAAWRNGISLTNNRADMGIDVVYQEMAGMHGEGMFPVETDTTEMLERLVSKADRGRGEFVSWLESIAEMAAAEYADVEVALDYEMMELEKTLRAYAAAAGMEVELRDRRTESEIRNETLNKVKRLQQMGKKTGPEMKKRIDALVGDIDTMARSISPAGLENLRALAEVYKTLRKNAGWQSDAEPGNWLGNAWMEERLARLEKLHIDDLTLDQVIDLNETVSMMMTEVENQKKLVNDARQKMIRDAARDINNEVRSSRGSGTGRIQAAAEKWFSQEQLSPRRFLEHLAGWKNGEMKHQAEALEKGGTDKLDYQMRAINFFKDFWTKNAEWLKTASGTKATWTEYDVPGVIHKNADGTVEIEMRHIALTPMMRVSLLMHSQNNDNLNHIQEGGVRIPDQTLYKQGRFKDAYTHGQDIKMQPETVRAIVKDCTKEEKAFAELLHQYMNGMSKEAINSTSLLLDGYERAGVGDYWPIETNNAFTKTDVGKAAVAGTVEGIGSIANERVKGAGTPLMLNDAEKVLLRNIENVSSYYGYAIPIHNFNAIYNTTFHEEGNAFAGSVKNTLEKKWGEGATRYIEKTLADVQARKGGRNDLLGQIMSKVRSGAAGATLTFNPSVALSQFASYPGAAQALGFDALAHGLFGKVNVDKVAEYTPLLWSRRNSDLGVLQGEGEVSLAKKAPLLFDWISAIDEFTIKRLWAASEYAVQKETKLSKADGDAFYEAVAEKFNRAVYDTQPNYTPFQRSQILRSDNDLVKSLTMFKTVGQQYYGMMYEAVGKLRAAESEYKTEKSAENKAALKEAQSYAAKTFSGLVVGNLLYAALKGAASWAKGKDDDYRDEEGNLTAGSFAEGALELTAETFAGSVMFGDYLYTLIEAGITGGRWYGPEVSSVEWFTEMAENASNAIQTAVSVLQGDASYSEGMGAIHDMAESLAQAYGLPVSNMETWLLAATKWIAPEWAQRYEALWEDYDKADLKSLKPREMEGGVRVLCDVRDMDVTDETVSELARLYAGGYTEAIPTAVPSSITKTIEGEEVEVTLGRKAREAFLETWNSVVDTDALLALDAYQEADDAGKAKMLSKLYDLGAQIAKSEAHEAYTVDPWVRDFETARASGIRAEKYIEAYLVYNSTSADRNENGHAITGSKAKKVAEYLNGMDLTSAQKQALYDLWWTTGSPVWTHSRTTAANGLPSTRSETDTGEPKGLPWPEDTPQTSEEPKGLPSTR